MDIFLNGVKVNRMANQEFEGAVVRFDARGDIHITVPGLELVGQQTGAAEARVVSTPTQAVPPNRSGAPPARPTTNAALTQKYWLASSQNKRGMAHYTVDVHINGQHAARITNEDYKKFLEVTAYIVPGENTVVFRAIKTSGTQPSSNSPEHYMLLMIGEGEKVGAQLKLDAPLAEYERLASQTENHSETQVFHAH